MTEETSKLMFSHQSDQWATPKSIYKAFMVSDYYDPTPLCEDYKIDRCH